MLRRKNLFPISRFIIEGKSMLPTINPNSSVISFNWHYLFRKPQIDDLVVVKVKTKALVKRIKKVEKNKIWLEGDNKVESTDSRNFGWIDKSQLIGKIILII